MSNFFILLAIVPPMLYSLSYFFVEKKGSLTKKFYLKYIFLFIISYILFFILYFLCFIFIDFITSILNKYNIDINIIPEFILFIGFYIFLMKKYFSFNDINLFFIFSAILSFILLNTGDNKGEAHYYALMMYFLFFIPLCWILFFINMVIQHRNSEKRKKQSQSDGASSEEDSL